MHERRRHTRHDKQLVLSVATNDHKGAGVSKNVSAGGVLFYSASAFEIGDTLKLAFRNPLKRRERIEVAGTVVRTQREPRPLVLRHLAAVRFEEDLSQLAAI
jgi:hypothetical protein